MRTNFLENLGDGSRNDSSIFEIRGSSIHSKCFSSSCLSIAHNSSIKSVRYRYHNILSAKAKQIFLRSVMHYFVELEFPIFLNIVDMSSSLVFWNVNSSCLNKIKLIQSDDKLTELIGSIWMFLVAKFGVGLVLIMTLTDCFPISIRCFLNNDF